MVKLSATTGISIRTDTVHGPGEGPLFGWSLVSTNLHRNQTPRYTFLKATALKYDHSSVVTSRIGNGWCIRLRRYCCTRNSESMVIIISNVQLYGHLITRREKYYFINGLCCVVVAPI